MRLTLRLLGLAWMGLMLPLAAGAEGATDFPPVGKHYKVLTVEKSENPQNIMIIYTRLDGDCRIIESEGVPLFDFYWLMGGERFKPTHSLIKRGIRRHIAFEKVSRPEKVSAFRIRTKDGERFGPEVAASSLLVTSNRGEQGCEVTSTLGSILVESFYGESRKSIKPPFRKVVAVTVKGTDQRSGEPVQKKFTLK